MTAARYLPGLEVAPIQNVRLVHGAAGEITFTGEGDLRPLRPFAASDLRYKREAAGVLGQIPVQDIQLEPSQLQQPQAIDTAWSGLIHESQAWLAGHVRRIPYEARRQMGYISMEYADEKLSAAVVGGVAIMGALLEVTPRAFMRYDFSDPELELQAAAKRSVGLLFEWMGLTSAVDLALAHSLARHKPRTSDRVFDNFRLDTRYIVADETGRSVILDPSQAPNLRDKTGRNHPSFHMLAKAEPTQLMPTRNDRMQKPQALFGCPMPRAAVVKMYGQMAASAARLGLFTATYEDERANHGY